MCLLCVLNVGCAIVRKDREEPVENGPREEKAEPVLKPSEVLKPKSHEIASPINDHFWVRGTYFQGDVTTVMRIDSTGAITPDGTVLSGEDDLGLDDVVNQGRMEFNLRMGERNNVRIDYFKLDRFSEVILTDPISFSDFDFDAGDRFRTELDWSTLSFTYTYSAIKNDRIEWGLGLGAYIFDFRAEGGEPGTLNNKEDTEAGIFPASSTFLTWRISRRWSFYARHSQLKLIGDETADGKFQDSHADIQFRWRPNLAFGLGYSRLASISTCTTTTSLSCSISSAQARKLSSGRASRRARSFSEQEFHHLLDGGGVAKPATVAQPLRAPHLRVWNGGRERRALRDGRHVVFLVVNDEYRNAHARRGGGDGNGGGRAAEVRREALAQAGACRVLES